ncbi:plastocyanin/azurin family copper-binding protein [Luteolibacter flavescens]|uniref:Plastocyanin/azurin family copper-binding protein n=1 Tax=Luteolibacter flavescens TaxID=1859460 RepID=A0ABT3FP85_9BACT|nr:plastocyanin/azurin family copper-binding protein [Luteolibacter flavescens]MCW1885386.1 plastocyanin/azurin family copper-binding protein [Luteolibacter flavescens]
MMRAFLASFVLASAAAPAAEVVKLELSADDRMVFSKTSFEVVSGQKVSLVFKNTSTKGEKAMKHNVVLLKPGTTIIQFAAKCNAAAATGYVPTDKESKEKMVGSIKLLSGGQTGTLNFVAGEPGEYLFFCSSPGHFDKMHGKIIVKDKADAAKKTEEAKK